MDGVESQHDFTRQSAAVTVGIDDKNQKNRLYGITQRTISRSVGLRCGGFRARLNLDGKARES